MKESMVLLLNQFHRVLSKLMTRLKPIIFYSIITVFFFNNQAFCICTPTSDEKGHNCALILKVHV